MSWDWGELKTLSADLGKASANTASKTMLAVRKSAFDLEKVAKSATPVDTGFLRRSLGTSFVWNSGGASAEVGPTAHYGVFVEFGTRRMTERPYMRPALTAVEPGFMAAMERLVQETLW